MVADCSKNDLDVEFFAENLKIVEKRDQLSTLIFLGKQLSLLDSSIYVSLEC